MSKATGGVGVCDYHTLKGYFRYSWHEPNPEDQYSFFLYMYVLKSSTKEVDREMDCMYIRWFKQDEHNRTLQNKYITIRFEQEEGPKKAGMIETVMMNK